MNTLKQAEHLHTLANEFKEEICEHESVLLITGIHGEQCMMLTVTGMGTNDAVINSLIQAFAAYPNLKDAAKKAIKQLKHHTISQKDEESFDRMKSRPGETFEEYHARMTKKKDGPIDRADAVVDFLENRFGKGSVQVIKK